MFRTMRIVVLAFLTLTACSSEHQDVGNYRIVTVTDGFAGFGCQPRTEFYFVDPASATAEPTYLGTCFTPQFVSEHLHMPHEPSCFAVSEDGSSLVYFHRPNLCGAGEKATRKPGGVYVHSKSMGDRFMYRDQDQITQVWSSEPVGRHSIRVSWVSSAPSRNGAVCPQTLIINADGSEQLEGRPGTQSSRCKDGAGRGSTSRP